MFRIDELVQATGGQIISRQGNAVIKGISIDTRVIRPYDVFIAIKGNKFDGHDFVNEAIQKGASAVMVHGPQSTVHSKNRLTIIKVKDTTRALGDIARFQRRRFNIPVIAVTGSNGKTTTKEMIYRVLSAKFKVMKNEGTKNNQIGLPLALLNLNGSHDIAVLELGTNHFGEIEYLSNICQPNIGIITNVGPSHLEYLGDLGGVLSEKYKMVKNLIKPRIAILNADDGLLKRKMYAEHGKAVIFGFGITNPCSFFASDIKMLSGKIGFLVNKKYKFTLDTPGYYNIYNALAALTVARIFGITYKDIALRLNTFDFPTGRLKFMDFHNIKFIDDTHNSNPLSLRQALNALTNFKTAGRKIFVMGDMLELGSLEKLFHYRAGRQAAACCDVLITVGNLSKQAARGAKASHLDTRNIFTCETIAQARKILFNRLLPKKGDLVLVKGSRRMNLEEIFKKA